MVRRLLAWMFGLALFNLVLFVVCFYWHEIHQLLITPQGLFLSFVIIAGLLTPLIARRYGDYRKREEVRKQVNLSKVRQEVENQVRKEIGIDF